MPAPRRVDNSAAMEAFQARLAARGLATVTTQESDLNTTTSPDEPGHPDFHRRARADFALARWAAATPPRYRDATATHPDVTAWALLTAADPDQARSLLLTGTTGTGKTHQAYGALRLLAEAGPERYELIATTAADLYGRLRPNATPGGTEYELGRLTRIPLLLLDDLGSAKTSEWTEEITYRLINERYNHCRLTIFTSNLPARSQAGNPDLASALGERIVSRLAEMTTIIPMTGADRRRSAA